MFNDVRFGNPSELLVKQLPPFAVAMLVADNFFKFGRFAPECLAFVSLWYVLDRLWQWVMSKRER